MYIWFLKDFDRLSRERAAIEELKKTVTWLVGINWSINSALYLDAVICVHGHNYEVRMTYPNLFPSVPPTVCPLDPNEHWSSHQYNSGTLCLEWGPDNWCQDITGANMLESVHKLLNIENPLGDKQAQVVLNAPSRHQLSLGQEIRNKFCRLYIGGDLATYLNQLPDRTSGTIKFSTQIRMRSGLGVIHELQPTDGKAEDWKDTMLPKLFKDNVVEAGVFFKTNLESDILNGIRKTQELEDIIHQLGHEIKLVQDNSEQTTTDTNHPKGILVLDKSNGCHFFIILRQTTLTFTPVCSDTESEVLRTPENYKTLSSKSVGIVGLGSVGSKIALTLARMGISHFVLIDHDIFFPENIERHVLDWNSLAEHKVYAIEEMLHRINANIDINVSTLYLTGQESTAVVNSELERLGQCDLIIDATADAKNFNLMTAVAIGFKKPLIWMEVYAGGVGGFIARSRPEFDPNPQRMRAIYDQYCIEHPVPAFTITRDYTTENGEGKVFTASDSDVSVIAHHAARFAVDTLIENVRSSFPYSFYLIGFAQWWVFTAPFHTIPIATDGYMPEESVEKESSESEVDGKAFILDVLQNLIKESDATSTSS